MKRTAWDITLNSIMNIKRIFNTLKLYDYRSINFRLIFFVLALSFFGVAVISSASSYRLDVTKQLIGIGVGTVFMIIFMLIRYEFLARYYWLIYLVSLIILALVLIPSIGHKGGVGEGAQRWIQITPTLTIQPSEFAKILLIIFFAALVTKNAQSLNSWKFLIFTMILAAIPIFLIFREPDLSTSIVTFLSICVIIFTSTLQGKYIRRVILVAVPLVAAVFALILILPRDHNIVREYQYDRIAGFFNIESEELVDEDIDYQQENAVLAIAGGKLTGKGLNNDSTSSVKNANFIIAPETDFIFAVIGEELGFAGAFLVILLLFLIVLECFRIGFRAREGIGKGIAFGFGSIIAFQTLINLGVVTMILPNTGLTLPFVSAGMSSLIVLYIGTGIVLNVGLRLRITF